MSSLSNQTCENIYKLLTSELEGTIWKDVCFNKLFGDPVIDMHSVMAPATFEHWLSSIGSRDNQAFESHSVLWFQNFCEQLEAKGLINVDSTKRFYYPSGTTILKDAYHRAVRKCDIVLVRKLDNQTHGPALHHDGDINILTPDDSSRKFRHSWKDILVFGEFKASVKGDMRKDTILQLSSYARETFAAQPWRRFVHAFTVCGNLARFYFFDRVGVSISVGYDISADSIQGQNLFMHCLFSYINMTASQLGFDELYKDSNGNTFLPNTNSPTYLHLPNKRFQLHDTLHQTNGIVSRGTLCWLATEEGSDTTCVVKEAWRDSAMQSEAKLWDLAKQKCVLGCLDVLITHDGDSVSMKTTEENNIRCCLDYGRAGLIQWQYDSKISTSKKIGISKRNSAPPTPTPIYSGSITASKAQTSSRINSQKRPNPGNEDELPVTKRKCIRGVVQDRTRSFVVVSNVGVKLDWKIQPRELVETIRDAIKCALSLYIPPFFFD